MRNRRYSVSKTKKWSKRKKVSSKNFFQEWLEKLQQESWQLELLISGLVLFGIFEGRSQLEVFTQYLNDFNYGFIGIFVKVLKVLFRVGWNIFFFNLLLHVILRAFWIGTIGLRYVSSNIDYDQFNYSEYFTNFLKKKVGSYDDFIERLEKVCSVLFAYTFLLFFLFLSLMCFFGTMLLIGGLSDKLSLQNNPIGDFMAIFIVIYLLLGLLFFIDFITLGGFKKIKDKTISKIYSFIYHFFSAITLSFLYRPLLYNFLDNKFTKRLFLLSIPYILIIIIGPKLFSNNNYPFFPEINESRESGLVINELYYDDLRENIYKYQDEYDTKIRRGWMPSVSLSQFYMDKPYSSVFVEMSKSDQDLFIKKKNLQPFGKAGFRFSLFSSDEFEDQAYNSLKDSIETQFANLGKQRRQLRISLRKSQKDSVNIIRKLDQLNKSIERLGERKQEILKTFQISKMISVRDSMQSLVEFYIDDIPYSDSMQCHFYKHPNFQEKGFLFHFKTTTLSEGHHNLKIDRTFYNSRIEGNLKTSTYVIPFIKVN